MAKNIRTVPVPPSEFGDRWRNALERLDAMEILLKAKLYDAAAVLAVQSTIAANDALTIARLGERCTSDRHQDAIALLRKVRDSKRARPCDRTTRNGLRNTRVASVTS